MAECLVTRLHEVGRNDLPLVGGKGANLGELVRNGFPVPDGFVVTTRAYDQVVAGSSLDDLIAKELNRPDGGEPDGSVIRAAFAAVEIPDQVREAIVSAYAALGRAGRDADEAGVPVAVRSSATAEDLPSAAFAGQQDTYLNVTGVDALLDSVRACWGSLWTDRAIAYRRRLGLDSASVRIAVVVQRMVDPAVAGVMFTANPVTGARDETVVDASPGLGEAVVAGLVTPEHYVLDRRGRIRKHATGRHEVVLRPRPGGGVSRETGNSQDGDAEPLPRHVLDELARLGRSVTAHFDGTPQDIEWAYDAERVWLLQSRPMTALPPPPVRLNPLQRRLGSTLLEYLPVRPYPLDMTTWLPHGPAGLMSKVVASFGLRRVFDGFLVEEDGVVTQVKPPTPRPTFGILLAPLKLAWRAYRFDPARWTEDPRFLEFERRTRTLAARDVTTLPWADLIRMPREALALINPMGDLRRDYLPRSGLALVRVLIVLSMLGKRGLTSDLILGAPTQTEAANRALEKLAAEVRDDPGLARAFATRSPAELASAIDREPGFARFAESLQAFLAEYGHRETVSPILVTPPTWADEPDIVIGLVAALAEKEPSRPPADRTESAEAVLFQHPLLKRSRMQSRVRRWLDAARAGLAFREDSHFYFTKPLPILRRALLEIGRRLCEAGVLGRTEDLFHLRLAELERIMDIASISPAYADDLRAKVRARSAKREELSGVPLIDPAAVFTVPEVGDALVTGTPGGGGVATGPVAIVRDPSEFARLQPGDVLVCPYTNPAWTPLFQRASAIVVDTGGVASHAAIVAREYDLPAVMGTIRGTQVLHDGQIVTVDGATGRVTTPVDAHVGRAES